MKKLVKRINKLLSWEPHNIFHSTSHKYINYESARADGSVGYFATRTHHTRLGEFFDRLPAVPGRLIKLVYYVISWPLYFCVKIPWEYRR